MLKNKNLTEIKALTEELQKTQTLISEAVLQFSTAFNEAQIGMAIVSLDGRFLQVNPAICLLLEYTETELLNKTFQEITYEDDLAHDLALVNDLINKKITNYSLHKRYITRTNKIIKCLLTVSLIKDENNNPKHFISQVINQNDCGNPLCPLLVSKIF